MSGGAKYFIVEAEAMPEIIRKVAEAKRHPFQDMLHGRIVTLQTVLRDEPGVLSGVLNVFAGTGINILTINQNIPVNGCAVVTITAETSALRRSLEELLAAAGGSPGVLRCEILAG